MYKHLTWQWSLPKVSFSKIDCHVVADVMNSMNIQYTDSGNLKLGVRSWFRDGAQCGSVVWVSCCCVISLIDLCQWVTLILYICIHLSIYIYIKLRMPYVTFWLRDLLYIYVIPLHLNIIEHWVEWNII